MVISAEKWRYATILLLGLLLYNQITYLIKSYVTRLLFVTGTSHFLRNRLGDQGFQRENDRMLCFLVIQRWLCFLIIYMYMYIVKMQNKTTKTVCNIMA